MLLLYPDRPKRSTPLGTQVYNSLIVADSDRPEPCPPALVLSWLRGFQASPRLLLRFAVLEVEAWILADRVGCARWLRVSESIMPRDPEQETDPKRRIVQLANRSRSRELRAAIVPQGGYGTNRVGPDYNAEVGRFVVGEWNPEAARLRAPSLDRTIMRLAELEHGV